MNQKIYVGLLILLLLIVIATMYYQFLTVNDGNFWIFALVLVGAYIASKFLMKKQHGGS